VCVVSFVLMCAIVVLHWADKGFGVSKEDVRSFC
jgi:hypothetical protein